MRWFRKVSSAPAGDYEALGKAIDWLEIEIETGRGELKTRGRIIDVAANLPSWVEYYYGVFMEVEAIMKFMELQIDRETQAARIRYTDHYNRALSAPSIEKYAAADDSVLALRQLHIHVTLLRNQLSGLHKGFDTLNYQLSNITKIRCAGIEDAEL